MGPVWAGQVFTPHFHLLLVSLLELPISVSSGRRLAELAVERGPGGSAVILRPRRGAVPDGRYFVRCRLRRRRELPTQISR